MVQLTDLLAVTQAQPTDWPAFCRRAYAHRAAPYALAALSLAQKLLAAPIPAHILSELGQHTPRLLRQRISQLSLADILQRTQQKPLTTIGQRLWRGWQDRAETARWAADWRGRWQVWQTALTITKTDTGQMLLKRKG
jgi:CO/xanthine dehydrogenase Mo-binding subunit